MSLQTLTRKERTITLGLFFIILAWGTVQTLAIRLRPYEEFRTRAREIGQALEAFAVDHQGMYPPDAQGTDSPHGLSPRYIQWDLRWNIDYEVHPNGAGGNYVGLEFRLPHREGKTPPYSMLTQNPEFRKLYGKGERIPGKRGRIFIFHESALIAE